MPSILVYFYSSVCFCVTVWVCGGMEVWKDYDGYNEKQNVRQNVIQLRKDASLHIFTHLKMYTNCMRLYYNLKNSSDLFRDALRKISTFYFLKSKRPHYPPHHRTLSTGNFLLKPAPRGVCAPN